MTRSTALLLPDHQLTATELRSCALDGEVVRLGEGFLPIDTPSTPRARAISLAPLILDARVIVAGRSAAWVWGWGAAPPVVSTCVSIAARIPSPDRRRLRTREVVIDDAEQWMLAGVAVTNPVRTLVDLARHDTGDDIVTLLRTGVEAHAITRSDIDTAIEGRTNLSFVRAARQRLAAALALASDDQPLLTR